MDPVKRKLRTEEFLRWVREQPDTTRYELVHGEPVAMAPERVEHARVKHRVARSLEDGIAAAGLSCEALPDGVGLTIDEHTIYEPDAMVVCDQEIDPDAVAVTDATVVVEVLSPSSRARDAGAKLEDYFRLASLRHYLLVKTDTRAVIHHARDEAGRITTTILRSGALELDPPGLRVPLDALFG
ncbi:MAG TPA: Uma2 family endonuclease [Sandaracinaceae bacterium LLY-WYZ-13_1]|nr:Uma2 family endonuclease [Sandaracinaceae bacterium LLY-WYZ-13_1]